MKLQTKRQPLVAGNWKMNGDAELAIDLQAALSNADLSGVDVLVCPPMPYLHTFFGADLLIGGQNLSEFNSGAHTGETAGRMLKETGCSYVLVGHSERRTDNHESNELVAAKVASALDSGLIPVLCVGEPENIREAGSFFEYVAEQIDAVVSKVGIESFAQMVIAYEPVWAIGTGKTASPQQAQDVHAFIRSHLAKLDNEIAEKIQILYGGSVKAANAIDLFSQADVDGGLIGGASLDPQDFLKICLAAKE